MYCRNCGNEMGEGFAACPNCGTLVNSNKKEKPVFSQNNQQRNIPGTPFGNFFGNPKSSFGIKNAHVKSAQGWISFLKVVSVIFFIGSSISGMTIGVCLGTLVDAITGDEIYIAVGGLIGLLLGLILGASAICKNMIYANIAENVNVVAKNTRS